MQQLSTLRVCYGNCGRTRPATIFLDDHSRQEEVDICVFTEVVQSEIQERDDVGITIKDSDHPNASAIKIYDSPALEFTSSPDTSCELMCATRLNWSNMRMCLFSIYLTRNTEIMPFPRFQRIITNLFNMVSNLHDVDLILITGDFNAYHSSWTTENSPHPYKRQRGEFLYNTLTNAGMIVLNDLRRGFNPTWMRGTTHTVNDLYIGSIGMDDAALFVTHEILNGSDHRLLTMDFDAEEALLSLQRQGRTIEGLEYRNGSVRQRF